MRWRVVVPLAVATAVTGAAAFVAVDRFDTTSHPKPPAALRLPARAPVLDALSATAARPTKRAVAAIMGPAVNAFPPGEQISGTVIDVTSGKTLWSRNPGTPAAPASTLKLLTAAAALRTLGPGFRFTTAVRESGNTIYLVGGGDSTLVESSAAKDLPASYPVPATLTELAKRTATALPAGQPVHVRVDTSAWPSAPLPSGWASSYVTEGDVAPPTALELDGGRLKPGDFNSPRSPDPASQAAAAFVSLLRQDGVDVHGETKPAKAPADSTQVAAVTSAPLPALVERLLTDSDNDLAEALGRAIALKLGKPATFAGETDAVGASLATLGIPPGQLSLQDCSGLSHSDGVAPSVLVTVLRAAARGPLGVLRPVIEGLPVAGFTGTLSDRYRDKDRVPGAGIVRAKTGSLTGVNSLAGLVVDESGRLLAFALLGSGTTQTETVEDDLDAVATSLTQLT